MEEDLEVTKPTLGARYRKTMSREKEKKTGNDDTKRSMLSPSLCLKIHRNDREGRKIT